MTHATFDVTVDQPDFVLPEGERLVTRVTVSAPATGGRPRSRVRLVPSASVTGFVTRIKPADGHPLGAGPLVFDVAWFGTADCEEDEQVFHGSLDIVVDEVAVAMRRIRITVPALPYSAFVDLLCDPWRDLEDQVCTALLSLRS